MLLQWRHGRRVAHRPVDPVGAFKGIEKIGTDSGRDQPALHQILHQPGTLGRSQGTVHEILQPLITGMNPMQVM